MNDGGLGARLETAVLVWILAGTLLIVGLVAAFGWPWDAAAQPAHRVPRPTVPVLAAPTVDGVKAAPIDYTSSTVYDPYPGHVWSWQTVCDPHCVTSVQVDK